MTKSAKSWNSSGRTFSTSGTLFDLAGKQSRIAEIEQEMAKPGFWDLGDAAQDFVKELSALNGAVRPLLAASERLDELSVLSELAEEEEDDGTREEVCEELGALGKEVGRMQFRAMLNGRNDSRNAYISIHAGAGGTESCDWADMLLRMYSRWAEDHKYSGEILDRQEGEQAGVRSVTMSVRGDYVYGYLQSEIGVHRLVRISPFDQGKRRHTSFASVDVIPEYDDGVEVEIQEKDLKIDTYRAGGAGGQHVNKTDSAVRITHSPTGIVVQCQNERSQHANRRTAMKLLQAKLARLEEQKREQATAQLYSEKGEIAWGNQIRSYVLQPFQMIKDHRTEAETGRVDAVLDGDLDLFIEAYLKGKMSG